MVRGKDGRTDAEYGDRSKREPLTSVAINVVAIAASVGISGRVASKAGQCAERLADKVSGGTIELDISIDRPGNNTDPQCSDILG